VPGEQLPPDSAFEEASGTLTQGLKACRAMVADYRAMLSAEPDRVPDVADVDMGLDVSRVANSDGNYAGSSKP